MGEEMKTCQHAHSSFVHYGGSESGLGGGGGGRGEREKKKETGFSLFCQRPPSPPLLSLALYHPSSFPRCWWQPSRPSLRPAAPQAPLGEGLGVRIQLTGLDCWLGLGLSTNKSQIVSSVLTLGNSP